MLKIRYLLPAIILVAGISPPATSQTATPVEVHIPKHYVVHKTQDSITPDGRAAETAWTLAEWTDYFMDIQGPSESEPFYKTRAKMLWDQDYLYFFARMEEEHVWATLRERDAVIFHNNDFEIFIKPAPLKPHYVEFEVNALGTLWDLILLHPYRSGGPVSNYWDLNGIKTGIHIGGSLNNPADTDTAWQVEMAIPLQALSELNRGVPIEEGSTWRLNFSRVQWEHEINNGTYSRKKDPETGRLLPEYNWTWTPQYAIDMHRPEHWGYLQFTNREPGNKTEFTPDAWAVEYQLLFSLFRQQLKWKKEHGVYSKNIADFGGPLFNSRDQIIKVEMRGYPSGYVLIIRDSNKGQITLNSDGYLSVKKAIIGNHE